MKLPPGARFCRKCLRVIDARLIDMAICDLPCGTAGCDCTLREYSDSESLFIRLRDRMGWRNRSA